MIHGDVEGEAWAQGTTLVIANCTSASDGLLAEIAERVEELPPGALMVSLSRRVACPHLALVDQRSIVQGWGDISVYIQQVSVACG